MMSPLAAAKAYSQIQGGPGPALKGLAPSSASAPDFAQLVKGAMNDISSTGRVAEHQMTAHANGRAELIDVVTAVASAQSSLETALAVRDQVISAYQEIMRMPI